MAKTEEGRIKDAVKTYLRDLGLVASKDAVNVKVHHVGWYHMPVQTPMGVQGQNDFHGHYKGRYFGIETKKNAKEEPTPLQKHQIHAINRTGAVSFVIRCVEDLSFFETWRRRIDREIEIIRKVLDKE